MILSQTASTSPSLYSSRLPVNKNKMVLDVLIRKSNLFYTKTKEREITKIKALVLILIEKI